MLFRSTLPGQRGGPWPGGVGAVLRYAASAHRLLVHEAPADGPAARAGIRAGDAVIAIDGVAVAALGAWLLFLMHGRIAGWRAALWLLVASAIVAVVVAVSSARRVT